ncbi:hypothetical protein [Sinomonas cyclohexanicum]|uniref:hypothetical protein n=1 Tax=Sinomonas cyclohexanicum TaxID=322009 RepID=UPI001E5A6780|nr:hypothetical protein [Corynebacterium cyclohexanicum]
MVAVVFEGGVYDGAVRELPDNATALRITQPQDLNNPDLPGIVTRYNRTGRTDAHGRVVFVPDGPARLDEQKETP